MIERLVIHRFRGIREGELNDMGKVNLLIGPNNSGKSAILEMLYLAGLAGRPCNLIMQDTEPSVWPAQTLIPRDMLGQESMPRLRERHGEPKLLKDSPAGLTVDDGLSVILKDIKTSHPFHKFKIVAQLEEELDRRMFREEDTHRVSLFRLEPWPGDEQYEMPAPLIPRLFKKKDVRIAESKWVYLWERPFVHAWDKEDDLDHLAVWAVFGSLPGAENTVLCDFHTVHNPFPGHFSQKGYEEIPGWEDKITKHFIKVFPALEGAKTSVRHTGFIEWPGRRPISIDHFGDGARHAFKMLAALAALSERVDKQQPGLFLWEDPELFMHPATLGRLLDEVMELVSDRPIQVFITTQSLEVIAWLAGFLEKGLKEFYDVNTFFLKRQENGILNVQSFREKEIIGWMEFVGDPRMISEDEMSSPLLRLLRRNEQ